MCELLCVPAMENKTTEKGREVSDKFLFSRELRRLIITIHLHNNVMQEAVTELNSADCISTVDALGSPPRPHRKLQS